MVLMLVPQLDVTVKTYLNMPGEKVVSQKGNVVSTKRHDKRDVSIISTNCSCRCCCK